MIVKAKLDRFEGKKAVLLVGDQEDSVNWPRELLPDTKEGDILSMEITVDEEATNEALAEVDTLFEQIIKRNQGNNS